jgi:hypothetical protein
VDHFTFSHLDSQFKFTIDLFADDDNTKCKKFYSNYWCRGTRGIDAFAQDWSKEIAWICPPVKVVAKVIQKISATNLEGILLVPEWPTAEFWPLVFNKKARVGIPI